MRTTKLFFDTEFTGLHKDTTLISIGFVSECGKTFYAEFLDYDKSQIDEWLQKNVIDNLLFTKHITASCGSWENWLSDKNKYRNALDASLAESDGRADMSNFECIGETPMIKNRLEKWLAQFEKIEMWSDCLAYDWVLFCNIFGHAFNIPKNIHYIPFDLATLFKEKGIDPDIDRAEFAGNSIQDKDFLNYGMKKHNAVWDAYVISECYNKLTSKTETAEDLLKEAIEKYNSRVNDVSKFKLDNEELKMFTDVMEVYKGQGNYFTPDDIRMVQEIAYQAGVDATALEN